MAVEEFKRGKGRGKAAGKARGSQGAGDELVEGGDLEEQTAAAAAAEGLQLLLFVYRERTWNSHLHPLSAEVRYAERA